MSKTMIFFFVVFMAAIVHSAPTEEDVVPQPSEVDPEPRLTCDLLSGLGVAHSMCALHCRLRGFRGGYCNDKAVCICRN